jgi:hypothetical protein
MDVDETTGGGGANVQNTVGASRILQEGTDFSVWSVAQEAGLRVAFRRSLRVGPQFGNDVEDFGVGPVFTA